MTARITSLSFASREKREKSTHGQDEVGRDLPHPGVLEFAVWRGDGELEDIADFETNPTTGKNPITQARYRAAGIGVIAPIFFMDSTGTWNTIVERRSSNVAALQKAMTLVPAGMLGWRRGTGDKLPDGTPHCPWGHYQAKDVELAILVEYAEELLDDQPKGYIGRDAFYSHPPIHALLNTYHAKVIFTGVSIDLPSLQAQICAIIFIPSKQWLYDIEFKLNYEWEYVDYNSPARQRAFTSVLTEDGGLAEDAGLEKMRPEITAPSGAAAFWYGIDKARECVESLMQEKEK